jgi:DNA-binding transcriptional MerR regulator
MSRIDLPDKIYFKIGEVSEILGLEPHVLRYWENEFDVLSPTKSKSGQRLYRRKDVEILDLIRDLLHRQKFTIKGAKQHLKTLGTGKAMDEKAKRDQSDHALFLEDLGRRLQKIAQRADGILEGLDED